MEIILVIALVVIGAVIYYSRKPKDLVEAEQAVPYKIDEPTPVVEVATPVAEVAPAKPARKPRAPKAPVAKKVAAKKVPAVKKPRAK